MSISTVIDEVTLLDQQGQHDKAINTFARAVKTGDLVAMTALAKRLLVGDRAPPLPKEGISFIMEASQKGKADAPSILSVLFALGFGVPQSWHSAQQSMATSASRGWLPAQRQLTLPSEQSQSTHTDWQEMALSIRLEDWQTISKKEVLSESPLITRFPEFISATIYVTG